MATNKQETGKFGETKVVQNCRCPRCKKERTLKKLITNFKCADVICDFCGFLGQVKTKNTKNINTIPKTILGAAWKPQKERMDAGIYFPLFLVLINGKKYAIYYLSADLQEPEMFVSRKPLSANAKAGGWQGFYYDMSKVKEGSVVRLK